MPLYQAIILGIVQGITEFFPISSSGHLIILPTVLGWGAHGLSFDAALHLGTALALLIYFSRSWLDLLRSRSFRMIFFIVLASVPVGLVGFFGADFIEANFRGLRLISASLIVVAVLMLVAETFYGEFKRFRAQADLGDVLAIGLMQIFALVPGVSRSGITILAGMGRGLKRERAAHFSFLISLPVVFAAGMYELLGVCQKGFSGEQLWSFAAGIGTSFVVGLLAIALLMRILRKFSLIPFAVYRIVLGALLLLLV